MEATTIQKVLLLKSAPEFKGLKATAFTREMVNSNSNIDLDKIINETLGRDIHDAARSINAPLTRKQTNGAEAQYREFAAAALQHQLTGLGEREHTKDKLIKRRKTAKKKGVFKYLPVNPQENTATIEDLEFIYAIHSWSDFIINEPEEPLKRAETMDLGEFYLDGNAKPYDTLNPIVVYGYLYCVYFMCLDYNEHLLFSKKDEKEDIDEIFSEWEKHIYQDLNSLFSNKKELDMKKQQEFIDYLCVCVKKVKKIDTKDARSVKVIKQKKDTNIDYTINYTKWIQKKHIEYLKNNEYNSHESTKKSIEDKFRLILSQKTSDPKANEIYEYAVNQIREIFRSKPTEKTEKAISKINNIIKSDDILPAFIIEAEKTIRENREANMKIIDELDSYKIAIDLIFPTYTQYKNALENEMSTYQNRIAVIHTLNSEFIETYCNLALQLYEDTVKQIEFLFDESIKFIIQNKTDLRDIIKTYQQNIAGLIQNFDATVAQIKKQQEANETEESRNREALRQSLMEGMKKKTRSQLDQKITPLIQYFNTEFVRSKQRKLQEMEEFLNSLIKQAKKDEKDVIIHNFQKYIKYYANGFDSTKDDVVRYIRQRLSNADVTQPIYTDAEPLINLITTIYEDPEIEKTNEYLTQIGEYLFTLYNTIFIASERMLTAQVNEAILFDVNEYTQNKAQAAAATKKVLEEQKQKEKMETERLNIYNEFQVKWSRYIDELTTKTTANIEYLEKSKEIILNKDYGLQTNQSVTKVFAKAIDEFKEYYKSNSTNYVKKNDTYDFIEKRNKELDLKTRKLNEDMTNILISCIKLLIDVATKIYTLQENEKLKVNKNSNIVEVFTRVYEADRKNQQENPGLYRGGKGKPFQKNESSPRNVQFTLQQQQTTPGAQETFQQPNTQQSFNVPKPSTFFQKNTRSAPNQENTSDIESMLRQREREENERTRKNKPQFSIPKPETTFDLRNLQTSYFTGYQNQQNDTSALREKKTATTNVKPLFGAQNQVPKPEVTFDLSNLTNSSFTDYRSQQEGTSILRETPSTTTNESNFTQQSSLFGKTTKEQESNEQTSAIQEQSLISKLSNRVSSFLQNSVFPSLPSSIFKRSFIDALRPQQSVSTNPFDNVNTQNLQFGFPYSTTVPEIPPPTTRIPMLSRTFKQTTTMQPTPSPAPNNNMFGLYRSPQMQTGNMSGSGITIPKPQGSFNFTGQMQTSTQPMRKEPENTSLNNQPDEKDTGSTRQNIDTQQEQQETTNTQSNSQATTAFSEKNQPNDTEQPDLQETSATNSVIVPKPQFSFSSFGTGNLQPPATTMRTELRQESDPLSGSNVRGMESDDFGMLSFGTAPAKQPSGFLQRQLRNPTEASRSNPPPPPPGQYQQIRQFTVRDTHPLPPSVIVAVFSTPEEHHEPAVVMFDDVQFAEDLANQQDMLSIMYDIDNPYIEFLRVIAGTICQNLMDVLVYNQSIIDQFKAYYVQLSIDEFRQENLEMDEEKRKRRKKIHLYNKFLSNWNQAKRLINERVMAGVYKVMSMIRSFSTVTEDDLIKSKSLQDKTNFALAVSQAVLEIEYNNPRRPTPNKKISPATARLLIYIKALQNSLGQSSVTNYFPPPPKQIKLMELQYRNPFTLITFDD